MSEAVLISIKPEWVEKIINGKKTIEVRKIAPKLETPFKCYIYCTSVKSISLNKYVDLVINTSGNIDYWHKKVVAEFTCDKVYDLFPFGMGTGVSYNGKFVEPDLFRLCTCLTNKEIDDYLDNKDGYGLHISDLKIYDQPKELSEFYKIGAKGIHELEDLCDYCPCEKKHVTSLAAFGRRMSSYSSCDGLYCEYAYRRYKEDNYAITRPPQSWCYVEELN